MMSSGQRDRRQYGAVRDLVNELSGPIFGIRMADGLMNAPESYGLTRAEQARGRAASTRFRRAAYKFDQAVRAYVRANPIPLEDPK